MEDNVDQFLALMEKYVDIPKLATTIVNEFIKQIIVYAPEKVSGKRTQKVKIVFHFLEEVEVPEISEHVITQTIYGRVMSRVMRKKDFGLWQKFITGGGLTAP